MDLLFCEVVEFRLPPATIMHARVAPSQEEVLRQMMTHVGLELVDYGAFTVQPFLWPPHLRLTSPPTDLVTVYSRAYRERREREMFSLHDR